VRRLRFLVVATLAPLALTGTAHAAPARLSVNVDKTAISTALGRKFVVHSTIENRGDAPADGLIAHLNVLSLRNGVYVDPEDWSSHRTRYLGPLPPHGAVTLAWKLQAVNAGTIGVYVAVLPQSGAPRSPVTGQTVHVAIADRKTLNAGGVLPLALGVPAALAALAVVVRTRRRAVSSEA
jgi:hypothetical protein